MLDPKHLLPTDKSAEGWIVECLFRAEAKLWVSRVAFRILFFGRGFMQV